MKLPTRPICLGLAVMLGVTVLGCGSRNPLGRRAVSGRVTFAGEPLDQGTISFEPQQQPGFAGGAVILDGRYDVPADKGLPPGKYLVRIYSTEGGGVTRPAAGPPGPAAPGAADGLHQAERIPAEFNDRSTHVVEVAADGPNQFDFDVPAK